MTRLRTAWNRIEHRLFSFVPMTRRAKPLISHRAVVDLVGAATTATGLTVCCELDTAVCPKGIVVSGFVDISNSCLNDC